MERGGRVKHAAACPELVEGLSITRQDRLAGYIAKTLYLRRWGDRVAQAVGVVDR